MEPDWWFCEMMSLVKGEWWPGSFICWGPPFSSRLSNNEASCDSGMGYNSLIQVHLTSSTMLQLPVIRSTGKSFPWTKIGLYVQRRVEAGSSNLRRQLSCCHARPIDRVVDGLIRYETDISPQRSLAPTVYEMCNPVYMPLQHDVGRRMITLSLDCAICWTCIY